ncbi:MAG: IS21-like element helper ATPase IstB [Bacteroidales bacterium]|nr:IS21-like element helper ATPase IstB [Bacteroidales bacterium]
MEKTQIINDYCRQFNLSGMAGYFEEALLDAQANQISYTDYMIRLFKREADLREVKSTERRLKTAKLPLNHNLDQYDHAVDNGVNKTRLNQLRELNWLDQIYNIVLMGPSGTGKTFIAAGLCFDAVKNGYKAYFRTMADIVGILKMKDYTRSAMSDYKKLVKANLIVIDDIMLFPLDKPTAVNLFNFVNQLFEKTSFIITTNKSPKQWAQMLDDEVLATALLDRLLYRCEVINLTGKSYRMKNRKTIFENKKK